MNFLLSFEGGLPIYFSDLSPIEYNQVFALQCQEDDMYHMWS